MSRHWFPILSPFANGDLGVDIFFVLSGFLIAHGLLKECQAHEGEIDVISFIRNRFLRVWPAIFAWNTIVLPVFIAIVGVSTAIIKFYLPNLVFIQNYYGELTHLWTVAVEFQMYLVSPLYVKWIYKNPSKAFSSTVALTILSTTLSMIVFYSFCACP
jgi:peptidoglycan/LPS O-acetylase OafA/YrhL